MVKSSKPLEEEGSDPASELTRQIKLPDGRRVSLRLITPPDRAALLGFARSLPHHDLLFLRSDITEPAMIDEWMRNVERGTTVTVLAESGSELVGYASLHSDNASWTRRVGEIRVMVASRFRGAGLGRRLAAEIVRIGEARGLKKLAAMMTPDQTGARAAFERLGFEVEALLRDWVLDRDRRPRDLLIMSRDLESTAGESNAYRD